MATGAVLAEGEADAPRPAPPTAARPKKRQLPFGLPARRLVEAAYVILLGFLIMRLVWAVTTPIEAPNSFDQTSTLATVDADLSVFSRFDPFGGTSEDEPPEASYAGAAETTLDLRLVGATTGGGVKTATIELPDGRQDAFAIGQEVVSGVSLRDVLPNQAILNRNGLTETLSLKDRDGQRIVTRRPQGAPAPPRPTAGQNQQQGPASPGEALTLLSESLRFVPARAEDGSISGYAIEPGQASALFEASGFVEGDIVTQVEGMAAPQDPRALVELMADLPPGRPFIVTVERDGTMLDVPVDLRAN